MPDHVRYAVGDLARLAGVSRRTVRYYVQEGLIPPPFGIGRGNHYGPEHLDGILRVKALQEAGRTLDDIRRGLAHDGSPAMQDIRRVEIDLPERSLWRRLTLAPGVELHISSNLRLPPPGRLQELAGWCRLHFAPGADKEHEDTDD